MIVLSEADYYRYSAPFRQWLYDTHARQLSDYKTVEAKRIFAQDFVSVWNARRLPAFFYEQGPNLRTNFSRPVASSSKPAATSSSKPAATSSSIRTASPSVSAKRSAASPPRKIAADYGFSKEETARLFSHSVPKDTNRMSSGPVMLEFDTEEERLAYQRRLRSSDRSFQRRRDEDLDELVPKKEGRAREVEARRAKAAYTRIERNPNDLDVADKDLLGSAGGDEYARMLRAQQSKTTRRDEERNKRQAERAEELHHKRERFEERERDVNEMFKKMLRDRKQ